MAKDEFDEQALLEQERIAKELLYHLNELLAGRSHIVIVPNVDKNGNTYGQRVQVVHPVEI